MGMLAMHCWDKKSIVLVTFGLYTPGGSKYTGFI